MNKPNKRFSRPMALAFGALSLFTLVPEVSAQSSGQHVNLYSYRQPFLIKPLLDAFTAKTGVKVNVTFASSGMLERLKAEGRNTPADAVLTSDIGRLADLANAELLQAVSSSALSKNIPAQYRDPKGMWYGLTLRARVLFVSKDRVKAGEIKRYEDLTDPKWRGRICTRSGKHVYNVSLLAAIVAEKGEAAAENWARGVKANLARRPQGNDRAQVKAVKQGICDIAIGNTYYYGYMATNKKKPEQRAWAAAARVVFPDLNGHGTHVNVSGAAVTGHAKNTKNAVRLLEFLSENFAQELYAKQNFEYPVKQGVPAEPFVASWGEFTPSPLNLEEIARHRGTASRIMDRVRFNN